MPSPPPIPPVVGPSGGGGYAAPLLLLPVRLETRFMDAPGGRELWLLVFPDQISVNTHEPKLTTTEVELAEDYWRGVWRVGTTKAAEERRPWERIAARLGARRAAWVVSQHTPNNAPSRPTAPTPDDK